MKRFAIWGFVIALIVAGLLVWQHFKHPSAAQVRQMLPGTWAFDDYGSYTIRPDGSYVGQFTNVNALNVLRIEGTFQVSDGFLIQIITYRTNFQVPYTTRSRILRANDHEIVITERQGSGNDLEYVFRKAKK